jgi:hypothetical protein
MKKLRLKAVSVGLLIDILGSFAVGLLLSVVIGAIAVAGGDTSPLHLKELQASVLLKIIGLIGTIFFTGLGGYYAAKLSAPNGYSNSLAVGLISLSLGVILSIVQPGITPQWKVIIGLILTVPAAMVGCHIAGQCSNVKP